MALLGPASQLENRGAIEGTRTPTPLRVHGPEPCASANSATMAKSVARRPSGAALQEKTTRNILQGHYWLSNQGRVDATTEVNSFPRLPRVPNRHANYSLLPRKPEESKLAREGDDGTQPRNRK